MGLTQAFLQSYYMKIDLIGKLSVDDDDDHGPWDLTFPITRRPVNASSNLTSFCGLHAIRTILHSPISLFLLN